MSVLRHLSLLMLLLAALQSFRAAAQLDDTDSRSTSASCSPPAHSHLFVPGLQRFYAGRHACRTPSSSSTAILPLSASESASAALSPPSVDADMTWLPDQAVVVLVQAGYWYVAMGYGLTSAVSHTLLKVDAASHRPVANLTLDSTTAIITMLSNRTHLFVEVATGQELSVLTVDTHTMQQLAALPLGYALLLSGVNAAGSAFLVAAVESSSATLIDAATGRTIAALDGGNTLKLTAAAWDAATDTAIVADFTTLNVYGVALNNTQLWSIALPNDTYGVASFAVDAQARSLYVFSAVITDVLLIYNPRFVQYDLTTLEEVARLDLNSSSVLVPSAAFSAIDGEVYFVDYLFGTIERVVVKTGAATTTSLNRFPFVNTITGIASLNGSIITAMSFRKYVLVDINAEEGRVVRQTPIGDDNACGYGISGQPSFDMDMHGNLYVPLCTLGVRVYSPSHELLHTVPGSNATEPFMATVTSDGKIVYVQGKRGTTTLALDVASGKVIATISVPSDLKPHSIAADPADGSLWTFVPGPGKNLLHSAVNGTLLDAFFIGGIDGYQMAIDAQRRRIATPTNVAGGVNDLLLWFDMTNGQPVQQFEYSTRYGGEAVAVTKDGALTISVAVDTGAFYLFRNPPTSDAAHAQRQQPAKVATE